MESPIGIFDSGIGGLTVLKEQRNRMPGEHYVYFGDTGRVPYGNKGKQTVTRYSIEITNHLLINYRIKALIVACNTASSLSVETLKNLYRIPIFEVVNPAVRKALETTKNGKIGVIGTSSTIRSGTYERVITSLDKGVEVFQHSCPLFVPIVEEGWLGHVAAEMVVAEYLESLKRKGIDTLILGCTHYPFLKEMIGAYMGEGVAIVDSATNVALEVEDYLIKNSLASGRKRGDVKYVVTDDGETFKEHGYRLLGETIQNVEEVAL